MQTSKSLQTLCNVPCHALMALWFFSEFRHELAACHFAVAPCGGREIPRSHQIAPSNNPTDNPAALRTLVRSGWRCKMHFSPQQVQFRKETVISATYSSYRELLAEIRGCRQPQMVHTGWSVKLVSDCWTCLELRHNMYVGACFYREIGVHTSVPEFQAEKLQHPPLSTLLIYYVLCILRTMTE